MIVNESRTRRCLDCFRSRSPLPSQVASETLATQAETRIHTAWKDKKATTVKSRRVLALPVTIQPENMLFLVVISSVIVLAVEFWLLISNLVVPVFLRVLQAFFCVVS